MQDTSDVTSPGGPDDRRPVVAGLLSRRAEIADSISVRILGIIGPDAAEDIEVEQELRRVGAALAGYLLGCIGREKEQLVRIPPEAAAQARRAARDGIALGTVIRCYTAAHLLMEHFVVQESDRVGVVGRAGVWISIQATLATVLDDLIVSISVEYAGELEVLERSSQQRRAIRVQRLLGGEIMSGEQVGYDLDGWHVGLIGTGEGAGPAVRSLTAILDCRVLHVSQGEDSVWAWLGRPTKRQVVGDVKRLLSTTWPKNVSFALGEPASGLEGWRRTHAQAQSASLVSRRNPQTITLYDDVALVAPWLRDDTHARWLIERYLAPLDGEAVSGSKLRETLRQYFAAGHNASAAASALNISRRTMRDRMVLIERSLGHILVTRQAEIELALRLESMSAPQEIHPHRRSAVAGTSP